MSSFALRTFQIPPLHELFELMDRVHWLTQEIYKNRFKLFDEQKALTHHGKKFCRKLARLAFDFPRLPSHIWLIWNGDPFIWAFQKVLEFLFPRFCTQEARADMNEESAKHYLAYSMLQNFIVQFQLPYFVRTHDGMRRIQRSVKSSLVDYIGDLQQIYGRLLLVRIDLGYGVQQERYADDSTVDNGLILRDWQALFSHVQDAYQGSLVGHAYKLEYARDKGFHIHGLFIFNGGMLRQDTSIGYAIGEHWRDQVTEGAGVFFNCNTAAYKARLAHCGIGAIRSMEGDTLKGVQQMAVYMAKPDYAVRHFMPYGYKRNFRRSSLTKDQKEKLQRKQKRLQEKNDASAD